jgi:hypothetical protein
MFGLRTRDAAGNVTLEITDRITRVLGTLFINSVSGSISHAGLSTGTPFLSFLTYNGGAAPLFSISGTTISWTSQNAQLSYPNGLLVFGVY